MAPCFLSDWITTLPPGLNVLHPVSSSTFLLWSLPCFLMPTPLLILLPRPTIALVHFPQVKPTESYFCDAGSSRSLCWPWLLACSVGVLFSASLLSPTVFPSSLWVSSLPLCLHGGVWLPHISWPSSCCCHNWAYCINNCKRLTLSKWF